MQRCYKMWLTVMSEVCRTRYFQRGNKQRRGQSTSSEMASDQLIKSFHCCSLSFSPDNTATQKQDFIQLLILKKEQHSSNYNLAEELHPQQTGQGDAFNKWYYCLVQNSIEMTFPPLQKQLPWLTASQPSLGRVQIKKCQRWCHSSLHLKFECFLSVLDTILFMSG